MHSGLLVRLGAFIHLLLCVPLLRAMIRAPDANGSPRALEAHRPHRLDAINEAGVRPRADNV